MRIGHGYDVHRLKAGRECILGGVRIPYECGPDGHSDADVPVHALMDAILGAAGLGDLGRHFPDTDDRFLGADSLKLLAEVRDRVKENGFSIGNVDITIIAQRPHLAPYLAEMKSRIADALQTDMEQINIKATTEEGLGFTGESLGIAAHAVVLLN